MKLSHRSFSDADKVACLELFKSNLGEYFGADEVADYEKFLAHEVKANNYLVFFSEDEPTKIIACGGFGLINGKLYLRWGMVDKSIHRQGLGSQLLKVRLEQASAKFGATKIFIDTSGQAQGFYEKYGFVEYQRLSDGFAAGIDKVSLALTLRSKT